MNNVYKSTQYKSLIRLTKITDYDKLPQNFCDYIEAVEGIIKTPIGIISVGPERSQTILRQQEKTA